jgi:hypothetical protein
LVIAVDPTVVHGHDVHGQLATFQCRWSQPIRGKPAEIVAV